MNASSQSTPSTQRKSFEEFGVIVAGTPQEFATRKKQDVIYVWIGRDLYVPKANIHGFHEVLRSADRDGITKTLIDNMRVPQAQCA